MATEHELVIILGAVIIHWIASTLCKVCIHLWFQNAGKGILRAHILNFFPSKPETPLEARSLSTCGSAYATPKASLF